MSEHNSVVAVYPTHKGAEDAVKELQRAGIDMKTLSIIGKDTHADEHVTGYYNTGGRMKAWGVNGAVWGGFWGLLFGAAFFAIPGLGPILIAGPFAAMLVGGLEGAVAVGGLSAIGAALFSIGIPKDSIIEYETALTTDHYLLMVHGNPEVVEKARQVLNGTQSTHVRMHLREAAGV